MKKKLPKALCLLGLFWLLGLNLSPASSQDAAPVTPQVGTTFLYHDRTIYHDDDEPPARPRESLVLETDGYKVRWYLRDNLFEEYLFCPDCEIGTFELEAYTRLWPLEAGKTARFRRTAEEGRIFDHEIRVEGQESFDLNGATLTAWRVEAHVRELRGSRRLEGSYLYSPELGWLLEFEVLVDGAVSRSAVFTDFRPPDHPLLPPQAGYPPLGYSPGSDDPALAPAPFIPAQERSMVALYDLQGRQPLIYEIGATDDLTWSWQLRDFHRLGSLMAPQERFVPFCPGCTTGRLDEEDYRALWPLQVGKRAEVERIATDGQPWLYEIAVLGTDILATPSGAFETYVIETRYREAGGARGSATYWYAPEPGWIVDWRETSPFLETPRSWRATQITPPAPPPVGPEMAPGVFNPPPVGTRMVWTEPATGITEYGIIEEAEGYHVYWTWYPSKVDEDPIDMDRFFFCMYCSDTQFPLSDYRSLWPLEVGKRIDFFRSNRWVVWSDSIEIIGTETLDLPFGQVDTYVIRSQTRSLTSIWRGEETVWFAPSIGWSVQFDYLDAAGRFSRWHAVSFEPPQGQ